MIPHTWILAGIAIASFAIGGPIGGILRYVPAPNARSLYTFAISVTAAAVVTGELIFCTCLAFISLRIISVEVGWKALTEFWHFMPIQTILMRAAVAIFSAICACWIAKGKRFTLNL